MSNYFIDCPQCGVEIEVEQGVVQFNCPHCGFQIEIDNRDYANKATKQAGRIQLPLRSFKRGNLIGMLVAIALCIGIGFYIGRSSVGQMPGQIIPISSQAPEAVFMPLSSEEARKMSYKEVKDALDKAGFNNIDPERITTRPWYRRKVKTGDIKEIVIYVGDKKQSKFKKDAVFKSDIKIEIRYYSFD